MLRDHYNSQELAESIVNLGPVSFLAATLETSVFYVRDKGEYQTDRDLFDTIEDE